MDVNQGLIYEESFEAQGNDYLTFSEHEEYGIDPGKLAVPYLLMLGDIVNRVGWLTARTATWGR